MIIVIAGRCLLKGYDGLTIFPFVFIREKKLRKDPVFMNHERIHLRQQLELLLVFFYLWYGLEFIYNFFKLKNSYQAYRNISFEREAYAKEKDLSYLKERPFFNFLKKKF